MGRADLTTKQYKNLKDLKKENLRDHMSNLELVLNMLAEQQPLKFQRRKFQKHLKRIEISQFKMGLLLEIQEEKSKKKLVTPSLREKT